MRATISLLIIDNDIQMSFLDLFRCSLMTFLALSLDVLCKGISKVLFERGVLYEKFHKKNLEKNDQNFVYKHFYGLDKIFDKRGAKPGTPPLDAALVLWSILCNV